MSLPWQMFAMQFVQFGLPFSLCAALEEGQSMCDGGSSSSVLACPLTRIHGES
jgi:hypothetical protein